MAMRFHCLGVGAIGSLIATNLAHLPSTKVRLILRRKDLAAALFSSPQSNAAALVDDKPAEPSLSLSIDRDGLMRRTDGLEVEMTPSPEDRLQLNQISTDTRGGGNRSTKFPDLVRNDPIQSLIVTTKAPATLPGVKALLPRLSSSSTVMICQNGMGVLEGLLDRYWPDDGAAPVTGLGNYGSTGGRPSFICATTTHAVWRKSASHFVHAGIGEIKFGVVPNRAVLASIASTDPSPWGSHYNNPLLNPRSLVTPTLAHLPLNPTTQSLHATLSALLQTSLFPNWMPLPTLQISQLQKLAVNASVNSLTAVIGVHNGALVGSKQAKRLIDCISAECGTVFAAHVAVEDGRWSPPPRLEDEEEYDGDRSFSGATSSSSSSTSSSSSSQSARLIDFQRRLAAHPPPPPLPASHPLSPTSLTANTISVVFATSVNLSSTLQDILASSQLSSAPPSAPTSTEIDYINGYIVALGKKYGIATPVVDSLGALVKLKEEMLRAGAIDRVIMTRVEHMKAIQASTTQPTPIFKNRPSMMDSMNLSSNSGTISSNISSSGSNSNSNVVIGDDGEGATGDEGTVSSGGPDKVLTLPKKRKIKSAYTRAVEQVELRRTWAIKRQTERNESQEDREAIRRAREEQS